MPRATPLLLASLLLLTLASAPHEAAARDEGEWTAERLAKDLEFPVDLAFGPDGTLYYAELRTGQVRALPPGASEPLAEPVLTVDSSSGGNGGFLGLVVDPDFAGTGAFFVYYSMDKPEAENGKVNRVSRVTPDSEHVLVDDIPWANLHDGGRLVFTDADTLVITTGDNEERDPAQDFDDLRGKTLRVTRDGAPAPDNPDPSSVVYTLGHRNPFGIAYDAENDRLWVTDNGPDRGDEVNLLVAGGNYGWPKRLGVSNDPDYEDPVWTVDKPIGPTGATVLHGDLYFGDFNNGHVHRITSDGAGAWRHDVVWEGPYEGSHALDVEAGPDGRLYVGTYDSVYVLTPPGGATPLPQPEPTADGESEGGSDAGDVPANETGSSEGADGDGVGDAGPLDEGAAVEESLPDPGAADDQARTPGVGVAGLAGALAAAALLLTGGGGRRGRSGRRRGP